MTTKICKTCNTEFAITRWQTTKVYCSGKCSDGWYENTNKKLRKTKLKPKAKRKEYIHVTTLKLNDVPNKIPNRHTWNMY